MKLYIKNDDGTEHELDRVQSIGEGDIVIHTPLRMRKDDVEKEEKILKEKLGRNVIILDGKYDAIYTVPPFLK